MTKHTWVCTSFWEWLKPNIIGQFLSFLVKYGFCKKSLLYSWNSDQLPLFFISFITFGWVCCCTQPKVIKKNEKKGQLVRVSFFRSDFLQNPYFSPLFTGSVHSDSDISRHCTKTIEDPPEKLEMNFSIQLPGVRKEGSTYFYMWKWNWSKLSR